MIYNKVSKAVIEGIKSVYSRDIDPELIQIQKTRKEFKGDYTLVTFPFSRILKDNPERIANALGKYLLETDELIAGYNVIKGFLNIELDVAYWVDFLGKEFTNEKFGFALRKNNEDPVVIEYSSPNTNKPLHLGHIRNNLLGYSIAEILEANGRTVKKVNLVNDRGIHICKTMLAYKMWAKGKSPDEEGLKGDKFVGELYVKFDKENKHVAEENIRKGLPKDEAVNRTQLMDDARKLLKKWENGNKEVRDLWDTMNSWVYAGFDATYKRMGVNFDKVYYESETYLLGKALVDEGLRNGILFRKDDGSVWIDLKDEGLDEKLLLRSDGTSVYMTQDLGTAQLRYDDYHPQQLLYVVGNEQNYHFDVLRIILKKLGKKWAGNILHVSYGMVELPEGKMKSREGTVVDADDLMDEMFIRARETTTDLGKISDFSEQQAHKLFETIGLGALKYFILKVDPKKNMLFNPQESIQFDGNTGPFIQYAYARIQSLLRKANEKGITITKPDTDVTISEKERAITRLLFDYPEIIKEAGKEYSPAILANFIYELVKEYNGFYQETPVLKETNPKLLNMRLVLSSFTGNIIRSAMRLLGIQVPERM